MVPVVPAFGGVPAGPELLIIFLLFAFLLAPLAIVAVVGVVFWRARSKTKARIEELEAEVERLSEAVSEGLPTPGDEKVSGGTGTPDGERVSGDNSAPDDEAMSDDEASRGPDDEATSDDEAG